MPKLKMLSKKLDALLEDPHPGLVTWVMAVHLTVREMAVFLGEIKE